MLLRANSIANEASGSLAIRILVGGTSAPPCFRPKGPVDHPTFNRQIVKFSTLAKLTHAKYGTSSPPADFDRVQNAISVAKMEYS